MPIPLIIWAVGLAVTGSMGAVSMAGAAGRISDAKKRYNSRRRFYEQAVHEYQIQHEELQNRIDLFGKTRFEAAVVLGEAVTFLERAKLKDRDLSERLEITPQRIVEWRNVSVHAVDVIGGLTTSTISGVTTAAAVYGLIGTLGAASTGTAISALTGVAAKSATLAWLGGGTLLAGGGGIAAGSMVFGGLVAAPALLAAGFAAHAKAAGIETEVERNIAILDDDETQKQRMLAVLTGVRKRADELKMSTERMSAELRVLLSRCHPAHLEDGYLVARAAKALGELLDVALLDRDGRPIGENGEPL